MRTVLAALAALLFLFLTMVNQAQAQIPPVLAYNSPQNPMGYQQITVLTASTALTVPTGAGLAIIECDSVAAVGVRWRDDGTAPTATVGMELLPGATMVYTGNLKNLRYIQVNVGAKLNISYYQQ